jgi:catechol 2,3-dioxygenase-like lactoylglutathione lyase family enzyme
MISGLDHANILSNDIKATQKWYEDVIGLTQGYRPDFGFPGVWLYHGGRPILHIVYTDRPLPEGALDHFSFTVDDFDAALTKLDSGNVPYVAKDIPENVGRQAFLKDPNGVTIELTWTRALGQVS